MIKILLCALNEAQNFQKLIPALAHALELIGENFEIIVCIDGSSDDSEQLLKKFQKIFPIKILPFINKRGLGAACNRVYSEAIKNAEDEDVMIFLDSDNTHDSKQITELLDYFRLNNLDVLIASRFCHKSTMATFPLHRQLISTAATILLMSLINIKKISGQRLRDYTSGYRLYKAKKIKKLYEVFGQNFISEPDFTSTCELILKLNQIGARIDEMPLQYDYSQKIGKSKFRIFRNSAQLILLITKYFFKISRTCKKA